MTGAAWRDEFEELIVILKSLKKETTEGMKKRMSRSFFEGIHILLWTDFLLLLFVSFVECTFYLLFPLTFLLLWW